jgi:hypothetical protein
MLRFYIGNVAKDIEAILDTVADAYRPPIYTLSRAWKRHRIGDLFGFAYAEVAVRGLARRADGAP